MCVVRIEPFDSFYDNTSQPSSHSHHPLAYFIRYCTGIYSQSPTPTPAPAPNPHTTNYPPLSSTLLSRDLLRAALDLPRRWAVDVVVWDPALIVRLLRQILGGNSRSVSANDAQLLIGWHGLLGTSQRAARALASLASALGLGEESLDPGLVHEVERSGGSGGKHKVEEDAGGPISSGSIVACFWKWGHTFGGQRS